MMRHLFLTAFVAVCGTAPLSAQELGKSACVFDRGQVSCGRVVATGQLLGPTGDLDLRALGKALIDLRPSPGLGGGAVELNPQECEILGGTIKADASCGFGITCQAANGNRVCIDTIISK
ncbi:MAG TPA: hypothetical protein VFK86_08635 [Bauldia sp.]|nr:hypothetical protein [Bauldia sp.]